MPASGLLRAAQAHYIRHALGVEEWPTGTTLQDYLESVREVVLDPGHLLAQLIAAMPIIEQLDLCRPPIRLEPEQPSTLR